MTFRDSCALLSSSRLFSIFFMRNKFLCLNKGKFHMDLRHEAKTDMELANVPKIVSTYRQALHTFSDRNSNTFAVNLTKLKNMTDSLRGEDLGLHKNFNNIEFWNQPNKAPCTYIEVFQSSQMNMSIFVLKPGFKMPLHDHPHMHGLLKVISGAVRVRSFSEYPLTQAVSEISFEVRARHEAARLAQGLHKKRRLFAKVSSDRVCRDNSETCTLTPTVSNYHEIEALSVPAAFFDILAPPYDTLIDGIGPRRCHYYHVVNEISTNVVELQETEVPKCFFCDQAPYLGPVLT